MKDFGLHTVHINRARVKFKDEKLRGNEISLKNGKWDRNHAKENVILGRFCMGEFFNGVLVRFGHLIRPNIPLSYSALSKSHDCQIKSFELPPRLDNLSEGQVVVLRDMQAQIHGYSQFMEILLQRVRATRLQFKLICCILIKFLNCCNCGENYMRFMKYDLRKTIVAVCIMSVPNESGDAGDRFLNRDKIYAVYAQATGLPVGDIINGCSIVRSVIIQQVRRKRSWLRLENRKLQYSSYSKKPDFSENHIEDGFHRYGNGYVTDSEVLQFNRMGRNLVHDYFTLI